MPSDSNGVYSLPSGYEAVNGTPIQPSQHNAPLEDLETAMTGRLPRNGSAAMTGALKIDDGTVSAPSLTFASAPSFGLYKTTSGIGVSVGGTQVGEFTAAGFGLVGEVKLWTGNSAPTGWLVCQGQSLSVTTYASLYAVVGTTFGAADGSHFNLPNTVDRFPAGTSGSIPLGGTGGEATHTLSTNEMPTHSHGITQNPHNHTVSGGIIGGTNSGVISGAAPPTAHPAGNTATITLAAANADITINNAGSGAAHNNMPPYIGFNFIIFTGVA